MLKKGRLRYRLLSMFVVFVLVIAFMVFGRSEVTQNTPINLFNTSNQSVSFNCSAVIDTGFGADNLSIANLTLFGNWSGAYVPENYTNNTVGIDYNGSIVLFNETIPVEGTFIWNCFAFINDSGTPSNESGNRTFKVDLTPPFFNYTTTDNASNANPSTDSVIGITMNATDLITGVKNASLMRNGTVVNTSRVTDNERLNLTYVIASNELGQVYNFTFNVSDFVGRYAVSNGVIITVGDGTPPGPITLNSPIDLFNTTNTTLTFNFTAYDNNGSTNALNCSINVTNPVSQDVAAIANIQVTNGTAQVNSTTISADGVYNWNVTCFDSVGLSNTSTTNTFTLDTKGPGFTNVSISPSSVSTGGTVAAGVAVSDVLFNVSAVRLFVNVSGQVDNQVSITRNVNNNTNVNFSYSVDPSLLGHVLNFTVQANDTIGNVNSTFLGLVTVDSDGTIPGPINLNSPIDLYNSSSATVTFNYTAYDNNDTVLSCSINVSQNGAIVVSLGDIPTTNGTAQINSTTLSNGSYAWSVNCTDTPGNVNTSVARNFTVDTAVPTFSNVSFSDTTPNPQSDIWLSAVWNGTFTLMHDVKLFGNVSGQSNYIVNSSTDVTDGNRINITFYLNISLEGEVINFTMLGNDSAGNTNTTISFIASVQDTTAPSITLNAPVANANTSDTTPTFNFTATDNVSTTLTCNITLDGVVNISDIATNSSVPQINTTATAINTNGNHNWSVACVDGSDNVVVTSNRTFTLDTTDPTITLNSPTNNTNHSITVAVTVTVDDAFTNVTISNYTSTCGTEGTFSSGVAFYPFNASGTTCTDTSGTQNLTITAVDGAGNSNTSLFTFGIDDAGPSLTLVAPSDGQTLENNVSVNWTVQEGFLKVSYVGFYLDGATLPTLLQYDENGLNNTASLIAGNTSLNFTPGNHTFKLTANDTVGNVVNTTAITFVVVGPIDLGDLASGLATTLGTQLKQDPIISIKNSSGYFNQSGSELSNQTFRVLLSVNTTGEAINVTLTDLDGSSANWGSFNSTVILTNNTEAYFGIQNNWTNDVLDMVYVNNSLDEFISNDNKYYGTAIFAGNTTTTQEFWWLPDESNLMNRTNITQCTSDYNNTATIPCWNYTSAGRTIVFVPHYSIIVAVNDTTAPNITVVKPSTNQTVSTFVPNITVSSDTASCLYIVNGSSSNTSMTLSGTSCTGSEVSFKNLEATPTYNITYYAIDNAGNIRTLVVSFNMSDTTPPNAPNSSDVSESSGTTNITISVNNINESSNLTIEYGTTVSLGSAVTQTNFNQSQSASIASLSAGTFYYYNVTVCDFNGNCAEGGMFNFTTNSASSGSSGDSSSSSSGGGGGGGTAVSQVLASASKSWIEITPDKEAVMRISNSDIGVTEIKIKVGSKVSGAELTVNRLSSNPKSSEPSDKVYQFIEIDKRAITNEEIETASIRFKISNSWFTENGVSPADIVVFKYDGSSWNELPTTLETSGATATFYEAVTDGFSYFAIGSKDTDSDDDSSQTDGSSSEDDTTESDASDATETGASDESDESTPIKEGRSGQGLAIFLIIVIVVAVGAVLIMMKKKPKRRSKKKSK